MNTLTTTLTTRHCPSRFSARAISKSFLTAIVTVTIATTAWKLNQEFNLTGSMLSTAFLVSTLLAIVYRLVNPVGWALVLRGFGYQVNPVAATRVWLHAESRRWLPGGIWGYASRAVASKEIGVSKTVASASMFVELLITIAAAGVVAVVGVVLHWDQLSSTVQQLLIDKGFGVYQIAGLVGATLILASVTYILRTKLKNKITGLTAKASALRGIQIQFGPMTVSLGYFIVMACLNGLVNLTLVQAMDATVSVPVFAMIAGTAVAWIIGFLAFFSPGGILVREATLAALLLPWMPYEIGFSLAMLSRFAQLIAEVAGMLATIPRRGTK